MKRNNLIIILITTLVFVLGGITFIKNSISKQVPDQKKDLIIGMELEYLPLEYITYQENPDGEKNLTHPIQGQSGYAIGYNVIIAKKLAEELKRNLIIKKISFDGMISALQNNEIHLAITGLCQTEKRLEHISFSKPYCQYKVNLILKNETKLENFSWEKVKKLKIGYQNGTIYEKITSEISNHAVPFPTYSDLEASFLSQDIDGFIAESPLTEVFLGKYKDKAQEQEITDLIKEQKDTKEALQARIGIKKDNNELLENVDKKLAEMENDFKDDLNKSIKTANKNIENNSNQSWYHKLINYQMFYWQGLKTTLILTFGGTIGAFIISLVLLYIIGIPQQNKKKTVKKYLHHIFSKIITAYIFIIKGIPMMLQAMFFYYGLKSTGYFANLTPLQGGLCVITFNSAAYLAEVMLKNMEFFDSGQIEAGLALGLTPRQTLTKVVLPQVIQRSWLRIMNEFIFNIKDSAVFSVIGLIELFNASCQIRGATFDLSAFIMPIIIYLLLVFIMTHLLKKLEKSHKKTKNY